jgi:hypothetical protein
VATGYLLTGKIRFDTTFPKLFKQVSVKGQMNGSLTISSVDVNSTAVPLVTVSLTTDLTQDFQVNYPDQPQEYLAIRFDFGRDSGNLLRGPTFRGYQIKALPAGPRPRQFVIPVLCYDSEKDKDGVSGGYPGFGFERLDAVEQLDSSGQVILFEDLLNERSWLVQIDQIEFRQTSPPGKQAETWGGILNLVLRTIN